MGNKTSSPTAESSAMAEMPELPHVASQEGISEEMPIVNFPEGKNIENEEEDVDEDEFEDDDSAK